MSFVSQITHTSNAEGAASSPDAKDSHYSFRLPRVEVPFTTELKLVIIGTTEADISGLLAKVNARLNIIPSIRRLRTNLVQFADHDNDPNPELLGVASNSILVNFHDLTWDPSKENFTNQTYNIDGVKVRLDIRIVNELGFATYAGLVHEHLRQGDMFMLVYSVTSQSSLDNIAHYTSLIAQWKDQNVFPAMFVGNHAGEL